MMIRYEKLEKLLHDRGVNRTALAAELGISSRTIAKIAKGERLSPIILNKISRYLGCEPADLYEEYVNEDAAAILTSQGDAFVMDDFNKSRNAMYIIDKNHRLVNFNQEMAKSYPELRKGDLCYAAIMKQECVCQACPLKMEHDEDLTFYNDVLGKWISIRRSVIYYPGVGECGVLISKRTEDARRDIRSRLPIMSGYDVYIEMNLTKNAYRIILPNDPTRETEFSKDKLDAMISRTAENIVHPNDRDAFLEFWDIRTLVERINGPEREIHGVFRECRKSGIWDTVYITIVPEEYYGTSDVIVMAFYMIMPGSAAALHEVEEKKEVYIGGQKINFDYLTGLPLRRSYWDMVENSPLRQRYRNDTVCILAIDVENFHILNNWYGREAGDALIVKIGEFLKSCDTYEEIFSGYMGGDNFCTIFHYSEETLNRIIDGVTQITTTFREDAEFKPVFGIHCGKPAEISTMDAYDRCILAMERREKGGSNICWYDEKIIEEQKMEEQLLLLFQKGMENQEITFYLQPKCDMKTGKIVGAEALARWNSEELGPISPAVFIPVLEKAGKISTLDYYIWQSVCRTISRWKQEKLPVLPISVNVSRKDVFAMDLVNHFRSLVEKYGLQTSDIEIEITESAYVENDSILRNVQSGLRSAGFHTLIDDFGRGYSSLNFLNNVESDAIKLDLNFLKFSESNAEKGTNIISSVLSMAEKLNLVTIAEGVETQEQAEFLVYKGCSLAQGYYYYKPMSVNEFEKLLRDRNKIAEDTQLFDYRPDPKRHDDFEIKVFAGFDENLEAFMKTLLDVAYMVRIVDVRHRLEFRLNENGHLEKRSGHCYDIWGRVTECKDCISAVAIESRQIASKYETMGNDTYYIIAKPIFIGGELYVMETAIKIM